MKIQTVECTVRVAQKGNPNILEIVRTGPDALRVTEIPLIRHINEVSEGGEDAECAVRWVKVIGEEDVTVRDELARLRGIYGPDLVNTFYPGGSAMSGLLKDMHLPAEALAKPDAKAA